MAKNAGSIVAALLGGALAGAVAALLLAPKSGKELRNQIVQIAREQGAKINKDEIEAFVGKVVAKVKDLCNRTEIEAAVEEVLEEQEAEA